MTASKFDVLQGTLDLMVLKTLEALGRLHGYGIARRIEQVSDNRLSLNQGTIYPALVRLQKRGWVKAKWSTTPSKRRAKFYSLTRSGLKQMEKEAQKWKCIAGTMARVLAPPRKGGRDGTDTSHFRQVHGFLPRQPSESGSR
jgi:transcriptional regulator